MEVKNSHIEESEAFVDANGKLKNFKEERVDFVNNDSIFLAIMFMMVVLGFAYMIYFLGYELYKLMS